MQNTPQERLKQFIKQVFKTQRRFAEAMGVSPQDVSKYVTTGGSVYRDEEKRRKLRDLGLNVEWYINGTGEMTYQPEQVMQEVDLSGFLEIEVYDLPAHANLGTAVAFEDLPKSTRKIELGMKLDPKNVKGMKVSGDSMSEARIYNGDIAIYDTSLTPRNGNEVIVILNGVLMIKRYENIRGKIQLVSAYNGKGPIEVGPDDHIEIIGVVKAVVSYR